MEFASGGGGGDGLARPRGPPLGIDAALGLHHYPRRPDDFLFAHIIAEVCEASALVTIALGLRGRVAPVVPGALQHR